MKILQIFKKRKLFLFNIFLTLYITINLVGGERGAVSFIKKKNAEKSLSYKFSSLSDELMILNNKNRLLSKDLSLDYLDTIYREKLKYGKKDEIIIKLK
jgi:cell division protein FtsB